MLPWLFILQHCAKKPTRACFFAARRQAMGTLVWFGFHLFRLPGQSITITELRISLLAVTGPPVDVGVTMYVLSISSVSEVMMVYTSSILLDHFSATRCTYEYRIVIASLCTCVDLQTASTTRPLVWFCIFIYDPGFTPPVWWLYDQKWLFLFEQK